MPLIFGGMTAGGSDFSDLVAILHNRDYKSYEPAPYKNNDGLFPRARFQHCAEGIGMSLIIFGGRTTNPGEVLKTVGFDCETCFCFELPPVNRYLHASCIFNEDIVIHGGMFCESRDAPTDFIQILRTSTLYDLKGNLQTWVGSSQVSQN